MKLAVLLSAFYRAIGPDHRIGATHISMYMALLFDYSTNRFQNPVILRRKKVMEKSKISSRTTYNRCLKELHSYGYIEYKPSFKYGESQVRMLELS